MTDIQQIFQQYAPQYLQQYGNRMPKNHIKTIEAILSCRTVDAGIAVYDCKGCGQVHVSFLSCGNRHCNICQADKTRKWLENQLDRQMPGHHFMITFTVPEQLRQVIRGNQRQAYDAMFAASSETLKCFAADPKYVGGDLPGFFGVLHTWGRQLQYHPHIHYVVTGGAVSTADGKWHPSQLAFFAPVKAMSKVFRGKLRDQLKKRRLSSAVDPELWKKSFNVNCQHMAGSHQSIRYLAPYVFKVAITNRRIIKVENDQVYLKYKKTHSNRWRTMKLSSMEFIRRFLQHVLPSGFMKIRYFGFMGAKPSVSRERVRAMIELAFGFEIEEMKEAFEPAPMPACADCGGKLVLRCVMTRMLPPKSVFDYG